eukprot:1341061-Amphidinium_carterae.1
MFYRAGSTVMAIAFPQKEGAHRRDQDETRNAVPVSWGTLTHSWHDKVQSFQTGFGDSLVFSHEGQEHPDSFRASQPEQHDRIRFQILASLPTLSGQPKRASPTTNKNSNSNNQAATNINNSTRPP